MILQGGGDIPPSPFSKDPRATIPQEPLLEQHLAQQLIIDPTHVCILAAIDVHQLLC